MADKKISELTSADALTNMVIPASLSDGSATKKITVQSILDLKTTTYVEYDSIEDFPSTGSSGVLYCDKDSNKFYRWTGTVYVEAGPTGSLSGSVTIPASGDTNFPSTSLLMHFAGANGSTSLADSSSNALAATAYSSAAISTSQSKFGGSSLWTGNTGGYVITQASSALSLGTGDFTVEGWIYATSTPSDQGIFDCRSGQVGTSAQRQDGFTLTAFSGSVIRIYSDAVLVASSDTSYINTWTHVAVVRESGTWRLYINGVQQGTSTASRDMTNNDFVIGSGRYAGVDGSGNVLAPPSSAAFPGYIDEFRVLKGICLYPAGTTFTPSTTAFLSYYTAAQTLPVTITG